MNAAGPSLSVVLACIDEGQAIRTTVAHLARQTAAREIELVLVGAPGARLAPEPDIAVAFAGVRTVEIGAVDSIARANAAGIRVATAPVVALSEDHCFPEPGWAAALIDAHRGRWSVVGPAVANANPGSSVSWADFVIGYGPWALPIETGEAPFLPGHNSSYKRGVLLALGDRLEEMLAAETVLHVELRSAGHRLLRCAAARVRHVNFSRPRSWTRVQLHNGRVFAGVRAREWAPARRAAYALASPLIPLVRLARCAGPVRRIARADRRIVRAVPFLVLGLLLDGAGQFLGYLRGAGRAAEALAPYEHRRIDHVRRADRGVFVPPPPPRRSGCARRS